VVLYAAALAVLLVTDGVEQDPGPVQRLRALRNFCVVDVTEIGNREHSVTCVDVGVITAMETL
jgi:hypothetical protein